MRSAEYQRVMELHDDDEPPFMQHKMYRDGPEPKAAYSYELSHLPELPNVPEEHHQR